MEDLRNGYLIQAHTFMPNNMDIADIRLRWERSTMTDTGWIAEIPASQRERVLGTRYNFNNIFLQIPSDVCPDRIPKEDQRITVEIVLPQIA